MIYSVKKVENCFSASETFEYLLPVNGNDFLYFLDGWDIRINQKLRRPAALAEKDGMILKYVLDGNFFRVSFPQNELFSLKQDFENMLRSLPCKE